MAKQIKCRKIEFLPNVKYFLPDGNKNREEILLKVDEFEAIRLKDLLDLDQEECAKKMEVSRQTFQNILDSARKKIAKAFVFGYSIKIEGGFYNIGSCLVRCKECGFEFEKNNDNICPNCGSNKTECIKITGSCHKYNDC